ncbi:MAG: glycine oxidase ThiO [Chloroflexi bacterium]|nr:glycine oxidase ThiO [Chloroflexota bacterium]
MPDAIVIGGGVMGLASARELRKRAYGVTLLDRAQPGRAASWASAGIIGATLRDESNPSFELRQKSRELWPDFAQAIEDESGLDPEYRETGCLQLATDESELERVRRAGELDPQASFHDGGELRKLEPSLSPKLPGGLLVAGGNVDNRRLCRALEIAIRRAGVTIQTGTEVRALATSGGRVTGVQTAEQHLTADLVVLAAGAWSATIANVDPRPPVAPQRGQILALDQTRVGLRHVLLTPGDPYFVPRSDGRLVIGATREEAGWDASLTAGGVTWLLNRAMDVVPALGGCPIQEMWTGFRPLSEDGLPLIGRGGLDGLFFLTGHGPSGIAPLPGSVRLLMAFVDGQPPPVAPAPFDPLRFRRLES